MSKWWTGYGRGWREEKATGFWPRFFQIMREPASTRGLYIVTALAGLLFITLNLAIVALIGG